MTVTVRLTPPRFALYNTSMLERRRLLLTAVLAAGVLGVYGQVYTHGFVNLDDDAYVSANPIVLKGLTLDGLRWAFTTGQEGHWSPLTWLSLMLDVQLFGVNPGAQHLVNVALHLANTLLLFGVLHRMTRAVWPSWIVAALFAVHPLHVESVAWISERKDVLSTLFWFLTLGAYTRYVEARSRRWYALTAGFLVAGLMAKSMLVTVPFVLLLLDFWPLGRIGSGRDSSSASDPGASVIARRTRKQQTTRRAVPKPVPYALLVEKGPLMLLTVLFCAVAYATQLHGKAMVASERLPLDVRMANAVVSYLRYLLKTVWPVNLAVFYPYDLKVPAWQPAGAALCLALVSLVLLRRTRQHPYALVGWLWYLGTLVPVIGLVQIGGQALADRYTYVPLVGIFVMVAWGGQALAGRWAIPSPAIALGVTAVLGTYAALAWAQVGLWKRSETLFTHAAAVTSGNAVMHNNLGVTLAAEGHADDALQQFRAAIQIAPGYADAYNNIGAILGRQGHREEAAAQYRMALRYNAESASFHGNLAAILLELGHSDEALAEFSEALRIAPDDADMHYSVARALHNGGRIHEALAHYQAALEQRIADPETQYQFGIALIEAGSPEAALAPLQEAIRLKPDYAEAYNDLGVALIGLGRRQEAIERFEQALLRKPGLPDALYNLEVARQGDPALIDGGAQRR